ncbi:HINT domain-containing protein [Flavobacterium azooxidireducens]|uniref:HINT domain-containing protein n=1 Tax=Flavobacterium azooxidireducens TaxID=1871076 RepID=A0ABY4KBE6_9FLAO|nr:polymorphic toxin-type HINT domain-containing protein [Flavobacterium azooxidireducens]UPQ78121.1 HINT domain-containing protein [Flavobacterium azooxidireducens]
MFKYISALENYFFQSINFLWFYSFRRFRFFVSLANPGNWESFVEGFKKFFSEIWSTLKTLIAAYFKKFTVAQNPIDFIKIFVEEITGIAIELFLLYVSLGVSATKKIAEGLERLLKNPKATVEDWMDYFKKRKKEDVDEKPIDKALDDIEKLKTAQKMWDELEYKHLLEIPPSKKPCFLAGTMVKTEKGLVPIEEVMVGQKIYAYNFEIKRTELKSVTQIFRNKTEKFVRIGIKDDFIEATGQHRFWLPEENRWEMANSLKKGIKLLNSGGKIIIISSIEVLSEVVDTYNLEVEDHHNYFVGIDEVLTHNKTRTSIFASTDLIDVEFYKLVDVDSIDKYVGQTIQGVGNRFQQHEYEYKKNPSKKQWMKDVDTVTRLRINGSLGPYKMTPYEAAVTELYEINIRGGVRKGNNGLYNKQKPIGKKKFEQFKKLGTFNPCKFYV